MKPIYLDYAAATPLDPRVFLTMEPFLHDVFGNASSFHSMGKQAKVAIDEARVRVADLLHARCDEILFTNSGTSSDNLAILGFARANAKQGKHLITSAMEHQAVLEAMMFLEKKEGFEVTYLQPSRDGLVTSQQVKEALLPDTILVSIMLANNEIGTIQPIAQIAQEIHNARQTTGTFWPVLHTDACQAGSYLNLDVTKLGVDMLTFNGTKVYGPKGSGCLFVRRGLKLQPLFFGGPQERGLFPGTENVAAIVGLSRALEFAQTDREVESSRLIPLRDQLIVCILSTIPKTRLNGDRRVAFQTMRISHLWILKGSASCTLMPQGSMHQLIACTSAALSHRM